MDAYDFRSTLTSDGLVAEVAAGTFAFKNKLKAHSVKLIWDKLGIFVAETLKAQKGVLLPNLGSFKVGPVVGEARKKIRVAFSLLEGRYGPVSQERPRFLVGGKAPVVQPNYALLSQGAGVHRGIGQRLLAELLQRLGVHILSSRAIKVEFPHLGKLVTNRAGRIEFVFDALFAEYFERECYAVIKEMPYSPVDYDLQSRMEDMALHDQDKKRSPAAAPVSSRMPVTKSVKRPGRPSYKAPLDKLLALCRAADRTIAGCVPRLRMEGWLQEHCSEQLADMSGAALMDLLDRFTYGKNSKQIMYGQFLDALDEALAASTHYRAPEPAHAHDAALDSYQQARADVADEDEQNAGGGEPLGDGDGIMRAEATATHLLVHPPYSPPAAPLQQAVSHTMAHMQAAPGLPGAPYRPPPTPDAYLHYVQNKLSPRSRADYDAFNRAHFQQLDAVRGRRLPASTLHRAVTPKVGHDLLNVREFEAVRSAPPPCAAQSAAVLPPPWAGSGQTPQ